ncbi:MAG TPA: type II toxin-antitoxin system ParD family antitoxin [Reyranella sp.]|nr:type II toxin-antitoxin system ParD family antitoxin [Reyranella sp.]
MPMERIKITMPSEMASIVQAAVDSGDYTTVSEVIREAVRDWRAKRVSQQQELRALKNDIQKGLADLEAGRLKDFDVDRVAARGSKLLPGR